MSYHSNKKMVKHLIQVVKDNVLTRTGLIRNLERFCEDSTNVWIYTEMPEAVKAKYDEYNNITDRELSKTRGGSFSYQYLRDKKMSMKEEHSKTSIILHNKDETELSLAWVFLHEIMHCMIKKQMEKGFDWLPEAISSMNWVHEDRIMAEPENVGKDYRKDIYGTDEGHELRPEEILCNLYASSLLGVEYDRLYWRANLAGQVGSFKLK